MMLVEDVGIGVVLEGMVKVVEVFVTVVVFDEGMGTLA